MKKKNNPPLSVSYPHSHQDTKSLKTNGARKVRDKRKQELQKKTEQLNTLYETGKKITSMISKEELLPWIAKQAAKLLDAEVCNYRIRKGNYLVRGGGTKEGMELMAKDRLKIGESLSGLIAKDKKPIVVSDNYYKDSRLIPQHRKVAAKYGFRSCLGVPMCIEKRVVGVLFGVSKKPKKFTKNDVELLTSFADMAAVALEKARLFEDLEQAKEKIEESEKNLKNFSGKILSIREDEKKRLASNLHDEFGSMEFAINSKLSIAEKAIEDNNLKEATRNINHIKKIIEKASVIFKEMAADLRPEDLDLIGLPNALKEYFSDFTKQSKIKIDFKMDIDGKKFGDDVAIALYRVAQEALNNVSKHANATRVKITLYSHKNKIILNISDNGKGFDIKKDLQKKGRLLRMGLIGMRERVESLGGNFLIKSAPEKGTRISITLTN